jgi:hypothetical protein
MNEQPTAFEASSSTKWMGEGGIAGEVGVDGMFLLRWRAFGQGQDDVCDLLYWVVHIQVAKDAVFMFNNCASEGLSLEPMFLLFLAATIAIYDVQQGPRMLEGRCQQPGSVASRGDDGDATAGPSSRAVFTC